MIILICSIRVRISLFDVVYNSRSSPKKRNLTRTFEYLRWKQWLSCFYCFYYCAPVCPKYKVKHVKLQMIAVIEGAACHGLNSGLYIWNGSFSCVPKDIWGQLFMLGLFTQTVFCLGQNMYLKWCCFDRMAVAQPPYLWKRCLHDFAKSLSWWQIGSLAL